MHFVLLRISPHLKCSFPDATATESLKNFATEYRVNKFLRRWIISSLSNSIQLRKVWEKCEKNSLIFRRWWRRLWGVRSYRDYNGKRHTFFAFTYDGEISNFLSSWAFFIHFETFRCRATASLTSHLVKQLFNVSGDSRQS